MKPLTRLTLFLALFAAIAASGQSDFEKYVQEQRAAFEGYTQQQRDDFRRYRDSLNREFAAFLEQEWGSFNLQKPEPPITDPIVAPPIYDDTRPLPQPEKVPVIELPPKPMPELVKPEPPKPVPIPIPELQPEPQKSVRAVFFGTDIALKEVTVPSVRLSGVTEKEVARYWKALSGIPYPDMMDEALRIKAELRLNDWGLYQLLGKMFEAYFARGVANEQVVFSVFMLNQLGYRAKIGRSGNDLIPLVAFRQDVYNSSSLMYGGDHAVKYSALNPGRAVLSKIETCGVDYAGATNIMDLSVTECPRFTGRTEAKTLTTSKGSYIIEYNKNTAGFYADYPCVSFSVYAEAALDATLQRSIEEQIAPMIAGKSQEEAVNLLLHLVQNAFKYKTDMEQYGYEKWNFAEETIVASYSDCEDRAILFTQLVRRLLKMPVVLVHYPGRHLATAVKFSNSSTTGDYFVVDGAKYLICDPTYINARLGMSMPNLRSMKVEIIKLR